MLVELRVRVCNTCITAWITTAACLSLPSRACACCTLVPATASTPCTAARPYPLARRLQCEGRRQSGPFQVDKAGMGSSGAVPAGTVEAALRNGMSFYEGLQVG